MAHPSSHKWLIRKASGSRARYKHKGNYSQDKDKNMDLFDDLPQKESIKKSKSYLDTSLVKRWLYSKVGHDFDLIHSEFLTRIQPKYLDKYRDCIFWYVERKEFVTITDKGEVWGKQCYDHGVPTKLPNSKQSTFYVDPVTNKLCKIPIEQFRK